MPEPQCQARSPPRGRNHPVPVKRKSPPQPATARPNQPNFREISEFSQDFHQISSKFWQNSVKIWKFFLCNQLKNKISTSKMSGVRIRSRSRSRTEEEKDTRASKLGAHAWNSTNGFPSPATTRPIGQTSSPISRNTFRAMSASSASTTATIPTPQLKVRNISDSEIPPCCCNQWNTEGRRQLDTSTTALVSTGNTRGTFSVNPPPVICASARTSTWSSNRKIDRKCLLPPKGYGRISQLDGMGIPHLVRIMRYFSMVGA